MACAPIVSVSGTLRSCVALADLANSVERGRLRVRLRPACPPGSRRAQRRPEDCQRSGLAQAQSGGKSVRPSRREPSLPRSGMDRGERVVGGGIIWGKSLLTWTWPVTEYLRSQRPAPGEYGPTARVRMVGPSFR